MVRKQRQMNEALCCPSKAAFITRTKLKRSPLKIEGDNNEETTMNNIENNNCNLKLGQFIPRHLVDYDERELIKIKRTMMGEHIPILRMLSTRLRYLRQLKSLWKRKNYEFMDILKQIQNDNNQFGNNTIFISFIQSILENTMTNPFIPILLFVIISY